MVILWNAGRATGILYEFVDGGGIGEKISSIENIDGIEHGQRSLAQ